MREEYGEYFSNIYTELQQHLHKHAAMIIEFYRKEKPRGKEPSYVKKHKKLIALYWKSVGMWKKESRA